MASGGSGAAFSRVWANVPSRSVRTRFAISPTAALCVMIAVVVPSSAVDVATQGLESTRECRSSTSSAPVGSSHSNISGALGDGAGDGDALLLAAGQLAREVPAPAGQPHALEGLIGRHRVCGDLGDEGHVLPGGEARDQVVELEDEPDVGASIAGEGPPVGALEGDARGADRPGRRCVEAAHQVEQGRLAAPRGAEQNDQLALREAHRDAAQRVHLDVAQPVHLAGVLDLDDVASGLRAGHRRIIAWGRCPRSLPCRRWARAQSPSARPNSRSALS